MNYVVIPVYDDDAVDATLGSLAASDITDYHVLSDSLVLPELPSDATTASIDEQLVIEINRELAMAAATRCRDSALARWGTTHRMGG